MTAPRSARITINSETVSPARAIMAAARSGPLVILSERAIRDLASELGGAEADAELGQALVARNAADQRRSDLTMQARRIEGLIEQAEAELERARRASDPDRDLLARIRAKVLGGAA